jgi:hypothetical protein
VVDELPAARVAGVRLLGERVRDHRVDLGWKLLHPLAGLRRWLVEVREDDRDVGIAHERHLAGEALEQHAAERVHIRAAVDRIASDLFGRDIGEGAEQTLRDVSGLQIVRARRDAEVCEIAVLTLLLRIDQDVARLDVAVDETAGVRRVERRGDLRNQADRARRLEAAVAAEHRAKIAPLDEAHRDVDVPIGLAGRIDRDHVRMVETRRQP